jgi:hypothetical protein
MPMLASLARISFSFGCVRRELKREIEILEEVQLDPAPSSNGGKSMASAPAEGPAGREMRTAAAYLIARLNLLDVVEVRHVEKLGAVNAASVNCVVDLKTFLMPGRRRSLASPGRRP